MRHCFILALSILMLANSAYAEKWICYDNTTKYITKHIEGDCLKLGLCSGLNNSGLPANCFEAINGEYETAVQTYKKINPAATQGSRIVDMAQSEIDSINQANLDAQKQVQTQAVNNLDVSVQDVMTAFVKVYNSKVPTQYQVTKQNIIDQIKADKGL